MKITKNGYLKGFGVVVIVLALIRCAFPSVAGDVSPNDDTAQTKTDSLTAEIDDQNILQNINDPQPPVTRGTVDGLSAGHHPILGVADYHKAFPDSNDIQMSYASKYGISPIDDRKALDSLKNGWLVYIGGTPVYQVDLLKRSVPYLVPRASLLLYDIGRNFMDSLMMKGLPLHKVVVTSVLRTKEDLQQLSRHNGNVSENSCHQYGTTFDISYNRYQVVADPDGPQDGGTRNDTLKYVLSEVLSDLRQHDRCLVKYEVKQGCFHITTK